MRTTNGTKPNRLDLLETWTGVEGANLSILASTNGGELWVEVNGALAVKRA